jgi:hypothetical protein
MKRKAYRDRGQLFISAEKDILKEFQELCDKERKSVSLKLNEMMMDELQKNPLGVAGNNPINVDFNNRSIKSSNVESLDYFIERNAITSRHWHKFYDGVNDIHRLERHEALTLTIQKAVKQRHSYLKTGKYLIH